jgi:hypothetical protein
MSNNSASSIQKTSTESNPLFTPKPHKPRGPKKGFRRTDSIATCDKKFLTEGKKQAIVAMLAQGSTYREIKDTLYTSSSIISNLSRICHDTIEVQRKKLAGALVSISVPVLARIERQVKDDSFITSTKDLAITGGILLDKYERLTGQPTQIIKIEKEDPGRNEYLSWLKMKTVESAPDSSPLGED